MPQIQTPLVSNVPALDVVNIRDTDVKTKDILELILKLYQALNNHAILLNEKDHGVYSLEAYGCCKQYFPVIPEGNYRGIARVTIDFGALPNNGTNFAFHNIVFNVDTRVTLIQACSNNPAIPEAIPIPYSSATDEANDIEIWVDGTRVFISAVADYSAYTDTFVVIEYTT